MDQGNFNLKLSATPPQMDLEPEEGPNRLFFSWFLQKCSLFCYKNHEIQASQSGWPFSWRYSVQTPCLQFGSWFAHGDPPQVLMPRRVP